MESENVLQIRRSFTAPAERIFQAWTQKEQFSKWFSPTKEFKIIVHAMDVRPGGNYRVEMQAPDGKLHIVAGIYREVNPPEKLVFSWSWETDPEHGETEVSLEFVSVGKGTELTLTQRFFPTRTARDEHYKGWTGCLDRLEESLA